VPCPRPHPSPHRPATPGQPRRPAARSPPPCPRFPRGRSRSRRAVPQSAAPHREAWQHRRGQADQHVSDPRRPHVFARDLTPGAHAAVWCRVVKAMAGRAGTDVAARRQDKHLHRYSRGVTVEETRQASMALTSWSRPSRRKYKSMPGRALAVRRGRDGTMRADGSRWRRPPVRRAARHRAPGQPPSIVAAVMTSAPPGSWSSRKATAKTNENAIAPSANGPSP
jgi:hypothetical protein